MVPGTADQLCLTRAMGVVGTVEHKSPQNAEPVDEDSLNSEILQVMLQGYFGKYGVGYDHSYAVILICIVVLILLVKQCRCCRVAQILFSCISPIELVGCTT